MDLSINQRLEEFLRLSNIRNEDLRIKLGIKTPQQITNWTTLTERIPEKHILTIIKIYNNLNARWLITGEGPMLNEGNPSNVIDGFKITEVGCPLCYPREREITTQTKLIALLEAKINELESSQNKKPTEKIGYKKDKPEMDKAADTSGKYKVTNEKQLKYNSDFLSDRVD